MTKIKKQNLGVKCKRFASNSGIKNKLSVKRMKLAICDQIHSSSSDDDHWPMLPPTSSSSSSSSLSPIEEEKNSSSVSTASTTGNSKYLSSLCNSSVSSLSSDGGFDRYKELHERCDEPVPRCSSKIGESSKSCQENSADKGDSVIINIVKSSKIHKSTQCDDLFHDDEHARHTIVEEIEHLGVELIQSSLHHSLPDIESYHQTKNFAFLLLNLALLSSNGNQIKYLLESPEQRPFLYYSLAFIGLSVVFQLIAKIFSLSSYRYNLTSQEGASKLRLINGFLLIFTLVITVLNIGISVLILFEIYEVLPL